MNEIIKYCNLKNISYIELMNCFNLAFSDYSIKMQLSEEELKHILKVNNVDLELSFGAFYDGKLVGFIINTMSKFEGEISVFDVGTAIIPEFRGKKIFTKLFNYGKDFLVKQGIKKYYLEVLKDNNKAIDAYKKQGFKINREFEVLSINKSDDEDQISDLVNYKLLDFDISKVGTLNCVKPSFENSFNIISSSTELYEVLCSYDQNEMDAFCIYSKDGRIVGLGYSNIVKLEKIVKTLRSKYNRLVIKNVDTSYEEVLKMLFSLGAVSLAKQYEMVKSL